MGFKLAQNSRQRLTPAPILRAAGFRALHLVEIAAVSTPPKYRPAPRD
jgi:hypothetical protein